MKLKLLVANAGIKCNTRSLNLSLRIRCYSKSIRKPMKFASAAKLASTITKYSDPDLGNMHICEIAFGQVSDLLAIF